MPSPNWQTITTDTEYHALTKEEKKKYNALADLMVDGMGKDDAIYMVEHGTPKRVVVLQNASNTSVNSDLLEIIKRRENTYKDESTELKNALKKSMDTHLADTKVHAQQLAEQHAKYHMLQLHHKEEQMQEMQKQMEQMQKQMQKQMQQMQQMEQMRRERMMRIMDQANGTEAASASASAASASSASSASSAVDPYEHRDWLQDLEPMAQEPGARARAGGRSGSENVSRAEVGAAAGSGNHDAYQDAFN
jgi:TolA-binding protein